VPASSATAQSAEQDDARDTVAETLRDLTRSDEGVLRVDALIQRLGKKGFGPVLLALGVPMLAPLPPGAPLIFAVPLLFICLQMVVGRHALWLPGWISRRTIERAKLARLLARVTPWVEKAERHLKPRLAGLTTGPGERVMGVTCVLVAVILVLPLPFANLLPSMAITAFGLAISRKDGAMALIGYGLVIVALAMIGLSFNLIIMGWRLIFPGWP